MFLGKTVVNIYYFTPMELFIDRVGEALKKKIIEFCSKRLRSGRQKLNGYFEKKDLKGFWWMSIDIFWNLSYSRIFLFRKIVSNLYIRITIWICIFLTRLFGWQYVIWIQRKLFIQENEPKSGLEAPKAIIKLLYDYSKKNLYLRHKCDSSHNWNTLYNHFLLP